MGVHRAECCRNIDLAEAGAEIREVTETRGRSRPVIARDIYFKEDALVRLGCHSKIPQTRGFYKHQTFFSLCFRGRKSEMRCKHKLQPHMAERAREISGAPHQGTNPIPEGSTLVV